MSAFFYYYFFQKLNFASVLSKSIAAGSLHVSGFNSTKINYLKMIDICNNLGDTKSLAIHPATTTHRVLTDKERSNQNIHENLVRLSVGLEDFEDIKNDLDQALIAI